jgi:hypothetical protein
VSSRLQASKHVQIYCARCDSKAPWNLVTKDLINFEYVRVVAASYCANTSSNAGIGNLIFGPLYYLGRGISGEFGETNGTSGSTLKPLQILQLELWIRGRRVLVRVLRYLSRLIYRSLPKVLHCKQREIQPF